MSEQLRRQVGDHLRGVLARAGISGTALAKRMHVSQPYVFRRVAGQTALDLDDLAQIAALTGLTIRELLPDGLLDQHFDNPSSTQD